MSEESAAGSTGVFVDPDPVDPGWAPPLRVEEDVAETGPDLAGSGPGRRRTGIVVGVVALVVVLVLGLVWAGGGFASRTDRATDVTPGTVLTTGPYEMSFSTVTVQKKAGYSDEPHWDVRVQGRGRTTGDATMQPNTGTDSMFLARDSATGLVKEPTGSTWGTENRIGEGSGFTPGLPTEPFVIVFEFPMSYVPGPTMVFAVFDLQFTDNSLLGNQDKHWNTSDDYYRYRLPVTRLPDVKS